MEKQDLHNFPTAGFLRRLMASVYDWLLVIALMMVASVPAVALLDDAVGSGNLLYQLALAGLVAAFFVGFWTHGGQTLGMKAWRLKLIATDGESITYRQAMQRFFSAFVSLLALGIGFAWSLWDRDNKSWHDHWSDTTIVILPKKGHALT